MFFNVPKMKQSGLNSQKLSSWIKIHDIFGRGFYSGYQFINWVNKGITKRMENFVAKIKLIKDNTARKIIAFGTIQRIFRNDVYDIYKNIENFTPCT